MNEVEDTTLQGLHNSGTESTELSWDSNMPRKHQDQSWNSYSSENIVR